MGPDWEILKITEPVFASRGLVRWAYRGGAISQYQPNEYLQPMEWVILVAMEKQDCFVDHSLG